MNNIDLTKLKPITVVLLTAVITSVVLLISNTNIIWVLIKGFSPIFTSFFIAYFLDYILMELKNRFNINRALGFIITMSLIILFFYIMVASLVPALKDASVKLYETISKTNFDFSALFNTSGLSDELKGISNEMLTGMKSLVNKITEFSTSNFFVLLTGVKNVIYWFISLIIAITISIYMLIEKKTLLTMLTRTTRALMAPKFYEKTTKILKLTDKIFKKFVIGKIIDSIIIGFLTYFVLLILKFEYAVLIAFIVGVTNVIPYVGPFIGAVPAVVITALASIHDPIRILYMALIILAIQQLDGLVIGPKILGDTVGVTPFWILIAITIGGAMFGFIGMFLGVPFTVLIKTLVENAVNQRLEGRVEQD